MTPPLADPATQEDSPGVEVIEDTPHSTSGFSGAPLSHSGPHHASKAEEDAGEVPLPQLPAQRDAIKALKKTTAARIRQEAERQFQAVVARDKVLHLFLELRQLQSDNGILLHQYKAAEGQVIALRRQREALEQSGGAPPGKRQRPL